MCVNLTLSTIAQTETITSIYNLEGKTPKAHKIEDQKHSKILKIINSQRFKDSDFILGKTLQNAIETNTLTIYKDKDCTIPFAADNVMEALFFIGVDTILTFDPVTFAEQWKVVRHEYQLFPNEETVYELNQQFTFNQKAQQLKGELEGIHVSYLKVDDRGETRPLNERIHIFSIKNIDKNIKKAEKELKQNHITWAKQIDYNITFQNKALRKILLSETHLTTNKIVFAHDKKTLVSSEILKEITAPISYAVDTIITFDPKTFKETVTIKKEKIYYNAENISRFRVAQDIYFDAKTNSFKTRILAIAPIRIVRRDDGSIKYNYPLFWIVYEDDFFEKG
jgi:hypothetical protein